MNPPNPPIPPNPQNPILPPPAPQRGARAIRGPQSALTDFLASHNISANQIRQDANARRAAALASQQTAEEDDTASASAPPVRSPPRRKETKAQEAKRKKEEEKAIAKIKASKQFQKRRRNVPSDEDITDEDEAARALFEENHAPLPGQMENCEICEKRFSVTAYSRAGPDGGLLCPKCSKDLNKEEGAAKKKRKRQQGRARRKIQSNLLDGIYPGAKSLIDLCIEALANNVHMADSFGDLPAPLVDKLSAILCKRRLVNSSILDLFIRPGFENLCITDGAKLDSDDFIRIFQVMPTIKSLRLKNVVQFKNKVMDHLLGTTVELESLSLYGANLIDDERWNRYLTEKGSHLRTLQVYWTDGHFGDEQLELLHKTCPDLQRLKIAHNQKVTDVGIAHLAKLSNLKHLTLEVTNPREKTTSESYLKVIDSIGSGLRTFSLANIENVDNSVLGVIHDRCKNLTKLRLVDNEKFTDEGFTKLFTDWSNPPLVYLDLHKCRQIDAAEPRENPDNIGLCGSGFEALMVHSGETLKHLNVHSCRHISREALESVFSEEKIYPELETIDLSFVQKVNDFVVGCIFRSCPNLKTLKVFGNFGVRDVRVPKGKILIGVPTALGMQIEGTDDGEGRTI